LVLSAIMLSGCSMLGKKPVPVAVSCPVSPLPPKELTESASRAQDLTPRYDAIREELKTSLEKAKLP
ncbi:hypothetical protein, partial [Mycobacterium tuberculosis]|uniref:hypothetical protein n=1 Tax=Mycobacterium tuberculosis TaxID=1773 RepID=UPI001C00333F